MNTMNPDQAKDENDQTTSVDPSDDNSKKNIEAPNMATATSGSDDHKEKDALVKPNGNGFKPSFNLIAILLLIVIIGFLVAFHVKSSNSSSSTQKSNINVPSTWKTEDTNLGFTVKIPKDWTLGSSSSLTSDGIISNSAIINLETSPTSTNTPSQLQDTDSVTTSTQKLTGKASEATFDKQIAALSSQQKQLLMAFGIKTNRVSITSTNIEINGMKWLKVTKYIPHQYYYDLYYWDNNKAIGLEVSNDSQQTVQQIAKTYVLPMAASLKIKS
jgi:hypothetical protein